jgi:hypothetical protein
MMLLSSLVVRVPANQAVKALSIRVNRLRRFQVQAPMSARHVQAVSARRTLALDGANDSSNNVTGKKARVTDEQQRRCSLISACLLRAIGG